MAKERTPTQKIIGISFVVLGIITVVTTVAVRAMADQNDPQLDYLFSALQASPSKTQAADLEREIWARWGKHPDDPEANQLMKLGINLMNAGRLKAAESVFTNIINNHPDFAEAWNKRATVRFFRGNAPSSPNLALKIGGLCF